MNTRIYKGMESSILEISDFSKEYRSVFEQLGYTAHEDKYIKEFPMAAAFQELNKEKHKLYEEIYNQMGPLQEVRWEEALLEFIHKIDGLDIDWWLTGSCALCLRGIEIVPHDIDIMLCAKDIEKLNSLFAEYIVQPIVPSNGWVVKHFGVLFLHARVDLAFDPEDYVDSPNPVDFGPYAMKRLEEIVWRGHILRVPPLDLQLQVNRRRERLDRVKAIEDYLLKT